MKEIRDSRFQPYVRVVDFGDSFVIRYRGREISYEGKASMERLLNEISNLEKKCNNLEFKPIIDIFNLFV